MQINPEPVIVDVWSIDLAQLSIDLNYCESLLDSHEHKVAQKFRLPHLREHYCVVHGLLRRLLADYLTVEPKKLLIQRTGFGKPYLSDFPGVKFNLSHSGQALVIAICRDFEIGIDVEQIRPRQNLAGLVERCFSVAEQRYWHALPESTRLAVFFKFWTCKEAFVKAVGRGIALGLDRCELDLAQPGRFLNIPIDCGSVDEWRVIDLDLETQNCAALVVNTSEANIALRDNRAELTQMDFS